MTMLEVARNRNKFTLHSVKNNASFAIIFLLFF